MSLQYHPPQQAGGVPGLLMPPLPQQQQQQGLNGGEHGLFDPTGNRLTPEHRQDVLARISRDAQEEARMRDENRSLQRTFEAAPLANSVPLQLQRAESYTDDELHDALREMVDWWILPGNRRRDFITWARERFDIGIDARVDYAMLARKARQAVLNVSHLMAIFNMREMINRESTINIFRRNVFLKMFKSIQYAYYGIEAHSNVINACDNSTDESASAESAIFRFSVMQLDDLKPNESLLLFALRQLASHGYRRYKGCCYEQVTIEGPTPPAEVARARAEGRTVPATTMFETHAWKQVCTIEKFIYDVTDRNVHFDQWRNLNVPGTLKHVVTLLENIRDVEFTDLVPDRHVFAFTTGIYDCLNMYYTPYVDAATGERNAIVRDLVACKYFQLPFPDEHANTLDDWYDAIETPYFQQVLDYQEMGTSPEERRVINMWMYVFIGRMLYEVNEMDQWQVMGFIKGIAGSGKSTIIKVIQSLYGEADVKVLSSNCQPVFALQSLLDCLLFVCPEVREDFQLSQGELQSMITGEIMAINKKYKDTETIVWKTPGFFVGNCTGNWLDAQGSISRRFVMWEFLRRVKDTTRGKRVDPNLGKKIAAEMPRLLLKFNLAYRNACSSYRDCDIWDVLPNYFKNTQRRLKAQINPLLAFISDTETFEHNATRYVYLKEFKDVYKDWLNRNSYGRPPKFVPDHYESIFEENSITIMTGTRLWNNESIGGQWVCGLGMVTNNGMRPDGDSLANGVPPPAPNGNANDDGTGAVGSVPSGPGLHQQRYDPAMRQSALFDEDLVAHGPGQGTDGDDAHRPFDDGYDTMVADSDVPIPFFEGDEGMPVDMLD